MEKYLVSWSGYRHKNSCIYLGKDTIRRRSFQMHGKQTYGPGHSISYKMACVPSEDSDQPAQMRRLIRVFAAHLKMLLDLG